MRFTTHYSVSGFLRHFYSLWKSELVLYTAVKTDGASSLAELR